MIITKEHWNGRGINYNNKKFKYFDEEQQNLSIFKNGKILEEYEITNDWGQIIYSVLIELKKDKKSKFSVVTVLEKEVLFDVTFVGENKYLIEDPYDERSLYYDEKEEEIECEGYFERNDYIPTVFLEYISKKPKRIMIKKKKDQQNKEETFYSISKSQSEFFEKNKGIIEETIKNAQEYAEKNFGINESLVKKVVLRKMKSEGMSDEYGELKLSLNEKITKKKIEAIIYHEFGHFIDFKLQKTEDYKNKVKEYKKVVLENGLKEKTKDNYLKDKEEIIARTIETIILKEKYGSEFQKYKEEFLEYFDKEYKENWYIDEESIKVYKKMFYLKK